MRLENKMTMQRQQGGKQKDWDAIRKHSDLPIITIITSTYNVVQDLQWTIDAIKNQTYPNLQWIIADGASTDGTIEILKEHEDLIDYWFSEPDTGIYDAWNKALEHVKGDWVQFIGAGDELFETDTLEKVATYLKGAYPNYDLVYGQVMHISEKGRKELYVSGEPWEHYQEKWEGIRPKLPVQTGIFHHIDMFNKTKFASNYNIIADCILLLESSNKNYLHIPLIVTKMPNGGISGRIDSGILIYDETKSYLKAANFKPPMQQYLNTWLKVSIKRASLKYFGKKLTQSIFDTYSVLKTKHSNKN